MNEGMAIAKYHVNNFESGILKENNNEIPSEPSVYLLPIPIHPFLASSFDPLAQTGPHLN